MFKPCDKSIFFNTWQERQMKMRMGLNIILWEVYAWESMKTDWTVPPVHDKNTLTKHGHIAKGKAIYWPLDIHF